MQDLLHHVPKNVTRRYSAPELMKLRLAVEKIVQRPPLQLIVGQITKGPHDLEQRIA